MPLHSDFVVLGHGEHPPVRMHGIGGLVVVGFQGQTGATPAEDSFTVVAGFDAGRPSHRRTASMQPNAPSQSRMMRSPSDIGLVPNRD